MTWIARTNKRYDQVDDRSSLQRTGPIDMTTLLQYALINSVTVIPLALAAFVIGRWARRPALSHAMWVLVLLKFVTPPLFQLPLRIEVPATESLATETQATEKSTTAKQDAETIESSRHVAQVSTARDSVGTNLAAARPRRIVDRSEASPDPASNPIPPTGTRQSLTSTASWSSRLAASWLSWWARQPRMQTLVWMSWLCGVAAWSCLQLFRAIRFHRRLSRNSMDSTELQAQTAELAARMGLKRVPQVLIVDAALSPMMWGCGSRAQLLFPLDLALRLDEKARATLLTHELAHFGRGDQWVRLLELIATALFWWHPVVWIARRQIEEAEEECCDAWVIAEFPQLPRKYAEALLDTIDFLCEARQVLPPVASGFGQADFLRRRLIKIMGGVTPKSLTRRGRWAIGLCAAVLLPLQPFVLASSSLLKQSLESIVPQDLFPGADSTAMQETAEPIQEPALTPRNAAPPRKAAPNPRGRKPGEQVWSTSVSSVGRFVIRATTARRVFLTDLSRNRETDLSDHRITAIAFHPTNDQFVSADQDGRVAIWDAVEGTVRESIYQHSDIVRSIAFSPNGEWIAAGSRDGAAIVIDRTTHQVIANLDRFAAAVNCVRFSPDGRHLAIAVGDWMSNDPGEVFLVETDSWNTAVTLHCSSSPGAVSFVSNDELIVGLWNGQAQLWNLVTSRVIGSALANKNVVSAAAFSPDNPVLREVNFIGIGSPYTSPSAPVPSQFDSPRQ
jgi:bla regulator protein BlaR1